MSKKSSKKSTAKSSTKKITNTNSIIIKAVIGAAILIGIVVGILYGCMPQYDVSTVPGAAKELIEASYDINTVFFGEGLPTVGFSGMDEVLGDSYSYLHEDSPYKSESEVKEAALKVYTEDYCNFLFEKAFIGQEVDFSSDDDSVVEVVQIPARYLTYDGALIVRYVEDDERLTLNRTYDTSSVTIEKKYRKKVVISVPVFEDGVPAGEETFTLAYTSDGWRLDDPTY